MRALRGKANGAARQRRTIGSSCRAPRAVASQRRSRPSTTKHDAPGLPAGAVVPERRNLFPGSNLEIPVPSRTGILGFLAGWACAGVLALALYVIAGT